MEVLNHGYKTWTLFCNPRQTRPYRGWLWREDEQTRRCWRTLGQRLQRVGQDCQKACQGEVMPLVKSPSKEAFRKNVKAEVSAGKPVAQSVAIAYSVKRQAENKKTAVKRPK
jgi:hypothetical protein